MYSVKAGDFWCVDIGSASNPKKFPAVTGSILLRTGVMVRSGGSLLYHFVANSRGSLLYNLVTAEILSLVMGRCN
jgi:hypothetical protein